LFQCFVEYFSYFFFCWWFRLKSAEVGKERAREIADGTYNMVTHFADMIGKHALMYMDAQKFLKDKWGGDEFPGSETSHDQQNN